MARQIVIWKVLKQLLIESISAQSTRMTALSSETVEKLALDYKFEQGRRMAYQEIIETMDEILNHERQGSFVELDETSDAEDIALVLDTLESVETIN